MNSTLFPCVPTQYDAIDPDVIDPIAPRIPQYDGAGNMTTNPLARNVGDPASCASAPPGCPTGQKYEYDQENRVIRIRRITANGGGSPANQVLAEYAYDALGRRVETIEYTNPQIGVTLINPRRTRHVYMGLETIQEYNCGTGSSCNAALNREFLWGDGNRFPEPIAIVYIPSAEVSGSPLIQHTYHYLRDVLGSVIGLTNEVGTLVERYTYDPYGKTYIEKWTGTAWTATNASSFGNPFMWTGQRYDAATGTYAFYARLYLPSLGRWGQRDPIEYEGGSLNLYEYVASAPINLIDPLGLAPSSANDGKTDDAKFEKCKRATQKALNKCLKAADKKPSATACSPPKREDCFNEFDRRMQKCREGRPGEHDEEVISGTEYTDCVGRCIDSGGGSLAGFGIMVLGKTLGGAPVPKAVASDILEMFSSHGAGGLGGAGKSTFTTLGSIESTVLRQGVRSAGRVVARAAFPLFVADTAYTVGLEAYCFSACK